MATSILKRIPRRGRECRAWKRDALLAVLALALMAPGAAPALAHPDSPSSPPLLPSHIRLKHQPRDAIIALFARERPDEHRPRAARSDGAESLLPPGVDAVLPAPDPGQLVVVGTESHPAEVLALIRVLDVPVRQTTPGRERVVLTLRHSDPRRVRGAVLRLAGAGSAAASGRQLTLEGSPAWIHRALRQVIRAELHAPETVGQPLR